MAVKTNKKWCKKCGICMEMCPREALGLDVDGVAYLVHPDRCTQCGVCEWICPDFALEVVKGC